MVKRQSTVQSKELTLGMRRRGSTNGMSQTTPSTTRCQTSALTTISPQLTPTFPMLRRSSERNSTLPRTSTSSSRSPLMTTTEPFSTCQPTSIILQNSLCRSNPTQSATLLGALSTNGWMMKKKSQHPLLLTQLLHSKKESPIPGSLWKPPKGSLDTFGITRRQLPRKLLRKQLKSSQLQLSTTLSQLWIKISLTLKVTAHGLLIETVQPQNLSSTHLSLI